MEYSDMEHSIFLYCLENMNFDKKQKKLVENNEIDSLNRILENNVFDCINYKISTITALFNLIITEDLTLIEISRKLILKRFQNKIIGIIYDPKSKASGSNKSKFGFPNVISIKILIKKKLISLNIFANGTIKISGAKSYEDCVLAANYITNTLQSCNILVDGYENLRTVLVKYEFQLNTKINLNDLYIFLNNSNYFVEYNPEKYNGLVLKTPLNIKITVFSSGKCFTSSDIYDNYIIKDGINWIQNIINSIQNKNLKNETDDEYTSQFLT